MAQEASWVSWVPNWCSSMKRRESSPTVVMEMPPCGFFMFFSSVRSEFQHLPSSRALLCPCLCQAGWTEAGCE